MQETIITGGTLIAILLYVADYDQNKEKNAIKKKAFFVGACILTIITYGVNLYFIRTEKEDKKNEVIKNDERYNTSDFKLSNSIALGDTILDSMKESIKKIDSVSKTLKQQLEEQDKIGKSTSDILDRTRVLLSTQNAIYLNTIHTLNPLFPLELSIDIDIPFDLKEVKPLVNHLYQLKAFFEEHSTEDTMRRYGVRYEGTEVHKIDLLYFDGSLFRDSSFSIENLLLRYNHMKLSFFKGKLKNFNQITKTNAQLNFELQPEEIERKFQNSFYRVYYKRKIVQITITWKRLDFVNDAWNKSNTLISSLDLPACSILFRPNFPKEVKVTSMTLTPILGLQIQSTIDFNTTKPEKMGIYFHKFQKGDFKPYDKYQAY